MSVCLTEEHINFDTTLTRPARLTVPSASSSHVGDVVRLQEEERLQFLHVVHAVTDDPGQAGGPDLLQLGRSEGSSMSPIFVPEPVAFPQIEELLANNAGKCRSHHCP